MDTSIRSNLDAVLNHLQHLHIPEIILAVGPRFPQKIELLIEDLQKIGIISLFLQNGDKTKVVVDDSAEIPAIPVDWWGNIKQFLIRNGSFNCLTWPWKFERVISKHSKCCSSPASHVSCHHFIALIGFYIWYCQGDGDLYGDFYGDLYGNPYGENYT